jgi:hypothetical protein
MVEQKDKIPTSPDSFRFSPPQVTPGAPVMGGPQSGGHTAIPKPTQLEPSPPDSMIRRTILKTGKGE